MQACNIPCLHLFQAATGVYAIKTEKCIKRKKWGLQQETPIEDRNSQDNDQGNPKREAT